ncbi:uncharacterized protein BJ171DRAFT_203901 [Polychytrium aggregatum]|uniref:uncharacterized protein n=1 Tax=Polychytrium aggregatum TaxID=110093 RepID=UPI0022FDCBD8|nr:uncharacterized protein BJ171DRAFT_203901 [Polychytrium aggregatum]KAI9199539.1 hypothetical protein BJ171DRAFT_203901 [Polychytrium aggregatum]
MISPLHRRQFRCAAMAKSSPSKTVVSRPGQHAAKVRSAYARPLLWIEGIRFIGGDGSLGGDMQRRSSWLEIQGRPETAKPPHSPSKPGAIAKTINKLERVQNRSIEKAYAYSSSHDFGTNVRALKQQFESRTSEKVVSPTLGKAAGASLKRPASPVRAHKIPKPAIRAPSPARSTAVAASQTAALPTTPSKSTASQTTDSGCSPGVDKQIQPPEVAKDNRKSRKHAKLLAKQDNQPSSTFLEWIISKVIG